MAEEQKPVAVAPTEDTSTTTNTITTAEATTAPDTVDAVVDETRPVEATEATLGLKDTATEMTATEAITSEPVIGDVKKEAEPVENGQLEHKGSNFPKNFIYTKKFFWFGSEAVDPKKIPALLKDHHLAAWASETGKGLLFFSEKGQDKTAPSSAIALHDAAEPIAEGFNKFVLSSKGHKHTFKAATPAERDNWVTQIKLKIIEAKELAPTVTESDKYNATLASLSPASPALKKEDKKEDKVEDKKPETETVKTAGESASAEGDAAPASADAAPAAAPTATDASEVDRKEEAKEEAAETKKVERKRSASRKRASIFGAFLGGGNKDKKAETSAAKDAKGDDKKDEDAAGETTGPTDVPAATAEPATSGPPESEEIPTSEPAAVAPVEEVKVKPAEKPLPAKRASLFGGLSFGKKKSDDVAPATPAKETAPISEEAPIIPKVDAVEPLSTDGPSPANAPVETTDVAPTVNGEKKENKSDKRKSSFPFAFGKRSEPSSPAAVEEGLASPEGKEAKASPFSKFRATIKNKAKAAEKPSEKTGDKSSDGTVEAIKADESKPVEPKPETAAEEVNETAKGSTVASTPAVTASA